MWSEDSRVSVPLLKVITVVIKIFKNGKNQFVDS